MSELVNTRLDEVDLDRCQIRITRGKGDKDRGVPFPDTFKETLGQHYGATAREGSHLSL